MRRLGGAAPTPASTSEQLKGRAQGCAQEVTSVPRERAEVKILLSQHLTTSRRSSPVIPSILLSKRQSHIFKSSFGVESDSGRKLIKCRNYCSIRFLLRSLTQQALGHRARTSGRFLHAGRCSHGLVSKRCPDQGWGACSFFFYERFLPFSLRTYSTSNLEINVLLYNYLFLFSKIRRLPILQWFFEVAPWTLQADPMSSALHAGA